eukprot:352385-Chlamydomonas_euryale.AAC.1
MNTQVAIPRLQHSRLQHPYRSTSSSSSTSASVRVSTSTGRPCATPPGHACFWFIPNCLADGLGFRAQSVA